MSRRNRPGMTSRALRIVVRAYQLLASPLLAPRCRFLPTCSDYAVEALASHGALHGTGLALQRLVRCHPWGGAGYDPVPERKPSGSARLGPSRPGQQS
jgi:uncharacterized protein